MELPDRCNFCGHENMVDFGRMEKQNLSNLYTMEGYSCQNCGRWKPCWFTTRQLDENIKRLFALAPRHPSFWYHFVKTRIRAEEIQRRGRKLLTDTRKQVMPQAA